MIGCLLKFKACRKCGIERPLDSFSKNSTGKYGRLARCKDCMNVYYRERYAANSEAARKYQRDRNASSDGFSTKLRREYGITIADYNAMLDRQLGKCFICRESCASGKRLSVDHDHRCCSGARSCGNCVRGLLCRDCNIALGKLRDDPAIVRAAAEYLEGGWVGISAGR